MITQEQIDKLNQSAADRTGLIVDKQNPEKWGCTDKGASNYDPEATIDDGSCSYPCSQKGET